MQQVTIFQGKTEKHQSEPMLTPNNTRSHTLLQPSLHNLSTGMKGVSVTHVCKQRIHTSQQALGHTSLNQRKASSTRYNFEGRKKRGEHDTLLTRTKSFFSNQDTEAETSFPFVWLRFPRVVFARVVHIVRVPPVGPTI